MYRILIITTALLLTSCGTIKQSKSKVKSEETKNKHVLAPNTASNKYSKMRQRN